jgi:hypothetical protein
MTGLLLCPVEHDSPDLGGWADVHCSSPAGTDAAVVGAEGVCSIPQHGAASDPAVRVSSREARAPMGPSRETKRDEERSGSSAGWTSRLSQRATVCVHGARSSGGIEAKDRVIDPCEEVAVRVSFDPTRRGEFLLSFPLHRFNTDRRILLQQIHLNPHVSTASVHPPPREPRPN